jgi:hypothetical protein
MSQQSWVETIYSQGAGTAIASSTTESLLVSDVNIPANYMYPGRILRITLAGKCSNVVTAPGTQTFRVRWGGISGTVLVASAALTQNVAAQTDKTWFADLYIQCVSAGATGSFMTYGHMQRGNCAVGAVGDIFPDMLPAGSLAAVTVDTTTSKALSISAQASVSTSGTSIQCLGYVLTSDN